MKNGTLNDINDFEEKENELNECMYSNKIDRYEIFAHISEGQSRALGAAVQGGYTVGGEISEGIDLNAQFGFSAGKDDHSAQFNSIIQNRYRFWKEVISRFEVGAP